MSSKAARGLKRTCQNDECGARFYDLNRDPISCPICESAYVPVIHVPTPSRADRAMGKMKKPEFVPAEVEAEKLADAPELDAEDVVVEDAEAGAVAAPDDTFLEEEEEEGGNMANIIGGPVAEGEEEV